MAPRKMVAGEAGEDSGAAILRMVKQRGGVAGARRLIVDAMPDIAEVLLDQAKKGSVPHLKLALELGGVEKRTPVKSAAKPVYTQRVERQLLKELDVMFPPGDVAPVIPFLKDDVG